MKVLASLALVAGFVGSITGCSTPAYSPSERHAQIARNWDYELKQATDDWDHILLLRPASHLSIWNLE